MRANADGGSSPMSGSKQLEPSETATKTGERSRSSRDETTARILDAAEELFSKRNPDRVTVREIAEAAGVTHPLIHQYVGSKADILAAVVDRGAPSRQAIMSAHPDFRQVIAPLFDDVVSRKVHSRAILRSAMDGVEYAPFEDRLKSGRMLLDLAEAATTSGGARREGRDAMDPRIVSAAVTSLMFGWVGGQDWIVKIFDLQDEDPAEVQSQLRDTAEYLAELAFPPAGESAAE